MQREGTWSNTATPTKIAISLQQGSIGLCTLLLQLDIALHSEFMGLFPLVLFIVLSFFSISRIKDNLKFVSSLITPTSSIHVAAQDKVSFFFLIYKPRVNMNYCLCLYYLGLLLSPESHEWGPDPWVSSETLKTELDSKKEQGDP